MINIENRIFRQVEPDKFFMQVLWGTKEGKFIQLRITDSSKTTYSLEELKYSGLYSAVGIVDVFSDIDKIGDVIYFEMNGKQCKAYIESVEYYGIKYTPEEFIAEFNRYGVEKLYTQIESIISEFNTFSERRRDREIVVLKENEDIKKWVDRFPDDYKNKYGINYLLRARRAELACINTMILLDYKIEDVSNADNKKDKYFYDFLAEKNAITLKVDVKSARISSEYDARIYNYPFFKKYKQHEGDSVLLFGCLVHNNDEIPIYLLGFFGEAEEKKIERLVEGFRFVVMDDQKRNGKNIAPWAFSFDEIDDIQDYRVIFRNLRILKATYENLSTDIKRQSINRETIDIIRRCILILDYFDLTARTWQVRLKTKIYNDRTRLSSSALYIVALNLILDTLAAIRDKRINFSPTSYEEVIYLKLHNSDDRLIPGFYDPMGLIDDIIAVLSKLYSNKKSRDKIYGYHSLKFNGQMKIKGSIIENNQIRWKTVIDHCYGCGDLLISGIDAECDKCSNILCKCGHCLCLYYE